MDENIALYLARRQKRLKYWRERFDGEALDANEAKEFSELFKNYRQLIATVAKAEQLDSAEALEAKEQLESIDREMTTLFEARRLMTSGIGVSAVEDYSTRGRGGSKSSMD